MGGRDCSVVGGNDDDDDDESAVVLCRRRLLGDWKAMDRPKTGTSVALSSVDSMSVSSRNSSLNGSQLNALIQRRSQLRAQLGVVEGQLQALPPSTARTASSQSISGFVGAGHGPTPSVINGQQRAAERAALPGNPAPTPMITVQPIDAGSRVAAMRPKQTPQPPDSADALPGAMRPGHYAFWPKRLPANQNRAVVRALAARREAVKR